jgi:LPXTG-motif cell wall-anchored protein
VKRLAAAFAFVLMVLGVAPGFVAPADAADPYTPNQPSSCHLAVPAIVQVNHAPRITITVRPSGPAQAAGTRQAAHRAAVQRAAQPHGTVEVTITRNGSPIFSRTVNYNGRPVTIQGPVITQPGHYVVHARFRAADNSEFRGCSNNNAFNIRTGPDHVNPPPPNGGNNPGGVLPDTGGPNVWWLVIALSAIGVGGGLVLYSKRRPPRPLYDI